VGATDGLYVSGRRVLSRLLLCVDGQPIVPVGSYLDNPAAATFVADVRRRPGGRRPVVVRRRRLDGNLHDIVEIRNVAREPIYVEVEIQLAADLAGVLDVYEGRPHGAGVAPTPLEGQVTAEGIVFARGRGGSAVGCRVTSTSPGVTLGAGEVRWEAIVPARASRSIDVVVVPIAQGEEVAPSLPARQTGQRLERWHRGMPVVDTENEPLAMAVRRSAKDLGMLRIIDPEFPERAVVAAAAPWFLELHARDALLAGWMSMVVDPDLALGALETLARFQGTEVDDRTEEQPGRIPHRVGFGPAGFRADTRSISYGAVDATPLFVMVLGELRRWGLASEVVERLLPHADRALDWITGFGDRDGDGYVEYQRATDRGERHQGWKDSSDPIRFPDGEPARGPIALAEVQGYVYAAYLARAHFAAEAGDDAGAAAWRARARDLQMAFNRDFWIEDEGWVALALDRDKRPVASLTSNVGHCLWTGILDEDKADVVAKHLVADDLHSGWGVRTLAASMGGYHPISSHTGAVWPHDNAACVAGLVRYGHVDAAHRILLAQLEAAALDGGRCSVLCGFDRDDVSGPMRYPDACTTRAWSAAAPLLLLRSLLRIDPWVPQGKLWLAPSLPPPIRRLRVERIPVLQGRVTVTVEDDQVTVEGVPSGIELLSEPRDPRTADAT
jgi:glycogen debranching enzyme